MEYGKENGSPVMDCTTTDNIVDNMNQSEYDQLCLDEKCKEILDQESEKIGQLRIEEAKNADDWMSLDEFGEYLEAQIKQIFKQDVNGYGKCL